MAIDKIINPNMAAGAYAKNSGIAKVGISSKDEMSFSDFLRDKTAQSIDTMKASETISAEAVKGNADLTDVVEAVTSAELTLQTVVAVRDRMVSAYQEIMRTNI